MFPGFTRIQASPFKKSHMKSQISTCLKKQDDGRSLCHLWFSRTQKNEWICFWCWCVCHRVRCFLVFPLSLTLVFFLSCRYLCHHIPLWASWKLSAHSLKVQSGTEQLRYSAHFIGDKHAGFFKDSTCDLPAAGRSQTPSGLLHC